MQDLISHELIPDYEFSHISYEERPVHSREGETIDGLHQVWISLNNPRQLNSYTTWALRELIIGFRKASVDRKAVAVVFTAVGDRSFSTGGNTAEYATYYAGRPLEYLSYMRLFNDTITSILICDKPVICRVNGMRIAGGQEIGMACDFSLAGDHARFGQAGPIHGSAPDGGSTDFLHLYTGYSQAAESLALCEMWSAHKALRLGLINGIAPVYKNAEGELIPNPFVIIDRWTDEWGRIVHGNYKTGEERNEAKQVASSCTIDLSRLDQEVESMVTRLIYTFPDCTRKTLESLRKKKLEHWHANSETNRSWLSLNMNTEAQLGFKAFHYGDRKERQIDFVALRRAYSEGRRVDEHLAERVIPTATLKKIQSEEGE